jgi:hypothetical protein
MLPRFVKAAGLAGFLGSLLGYEVFHTTFPSVSVPSVGEPSPLFTFGSLFAGALLVGILTDDLVAGIVQAFAAIPVGATVASALALSPLLAGLGLADPGDLVFFVIRSGFPLFFTTILIGIMCVLLGAGVRGKLRVGRL